MNPIPNNAESNAQLAGYYSTSSPTSSGYYGSNYWTNYPTYNGSYQGYNGYYTSRPYPYPTTAGYYSSPTDYSSYYYQSSNNSSINYETNDVSVNSCGESLSSPSSSLSSSVIVNSPTSIPPYSSSFSNSIDSGECSFTSTGNKQPDVSPTTQAPISVRTTVQSTATFSRKHQLPDRAVDIMNEWFEEHLHNPYPQLCEKEKLAELGGITVKQVTAWFSNRRNRSQNTKPKRMKRVLEKEIGEIYQELVYNPNKQQIIEKFRHTLANHELSLLN